MSVLFAELNQGRGMLEPELVLDGNATHIPFHCCLCHQPFLNDDNGILQQDPMVYVISKDPTAGGVAAAAAQQVYGIHTKCIPLYDEQQKINDYSRIDLSLDQQHQIDSYVPTARIEFIQHILEHSHKSKLELIRKYENCVKFTIKPISVDTGASTACILKFPSNVSPYLKLVKELFAYGYGKGWFETIVKIKIVKRNNTSEKAQMEELERSLQTVTRSRKPPLPPLPFEIISWSHKIKSQAIQVSTTPGQVSSLLQSETHWKLIVSIRYEQKRLLNQLYDFYNAFLEPGQSVGDGYMTFERFLQTAEQFASEPKSPFAFQTLPGIQRMKHASWLTSLQTYEKSVNDFTTELVNVLIQSSVSAEVIGPNLHGNNVHEVISSTGESYLHMNINVQTIDMRMIGTTDDNLYYCLAEDGSNIYAFIQDNSNNNGSGGERNLPIYVPGGGGNAISYPGFKLVDLDMLADLMKLNLPKNLKG